MKISLIGAGYVGLVTGVCFAEIGHQVSVFDVDKEKIGKLKKGNCPIYEEKLTYLLQKNLKKKRIFFFDNLEDAIKDSKVIFNAVGTPPDEQRKVDLRYVWKVAREVGKFINHYVVFVNKSTVPVGTTEKTKKIIKENLKKNVNFDVASNPEFLREGSAVRDFLKPDRIVIGIESKKAERILREAYRPIIQKGYPLLVTDIKSAEMIKYASNAFLAVKLSFINELANLCEKVGANIKEVIKGIGLDKRIGPYYLKPGPGFGGSCLPKDVDGLIYTGLDAGMKLQILEAARKINQSQQLIGIQKLKKYLPNIFGKTIAVWGLAFKTGTDDIRESSAIKTIQKLIQEGAKIKCFDPVATENAKKIFTDFKKVEFCKDKFETLKSATALLILTDWEEFKKVNPKEIKKYLKIVIDTRNIFDKKEFQKAGLIYEGIGV